MPPARLASQRTVRRAPVASLVHDDALRDLVDLARAEVRELGHAPGELGDAAREMRLAFDLRRYGFTQGNTSALSHKIRL